MIDKIKDFIEKIKDFVEENKVIIIKGLMVLLIIILVVFLISKIKIKDNDDYAENSNTFYENLDVMKEEALKYFDESNLPTEVDESKTITLKDLIEKNKLSPLKDEDNNVCDYKNSYITITKKENEYQMKVNLSCADVEDYVIAHLNHYDYCKGTYLCTKKAENVIIEDKKGEKDDNISDTNNKKNVINLSKSKTNNIKNNKTNKVKGNVSYSNNKKTTLSYEYTKKIGGVLSNWSNWSSEVKTSCNTKNLTCNNNDKNCLTEVKININKKRIGTEYKKESYNKVNIINTGRKTQVYTCSGSEYVNVDGKLYRVRSIEGYSSIYGRDGNLTNTGDWKLINSNYYSQSPTDTYDTHYIFTGDTDDQKRRQYDKYVYTKFIDRAPVKIDSCSTNVTKYIPQFASENRVTNVIISEDVFENVCYKSERKRKITNYTTSTKWSSYNDTKLLNNGYTYTGRLKKR